MKKWPSERGSRYQSYGLATTPAVFWGSDKCTFEFAANPEYGTHDRMQRLHLFPKFLAGANLLFGVCVVRLNLLSREHLIRQTEGRHKKW